MLSCFSRVRFFGTLWTVAHQAPLSMEFSRQEFWSGLPCPPPGDLPNPGIESRSPPLQVDSLLFEPPGKPRILERVAHPFSRESSWPRNRTGISWIAGGFFISWATREALIFIISVKLRNFHIISNQDNKVYLLLAIFLHRLKEKLKISDDYLYIHIKKRL